MRRIENQQLGNIGEDTAVKYLKRQGYRILERNFRLKLGEIDIIALDNKELVFVEVKTRDSNNYEFLVSSVNKNKEKRLIKTASYYMQKKNLEDITGRFDIIFVTGSNGHMEIEHLKDAFMADGDLC